MDLTQLNEAIKQKGFSIQISNTDSPWHHEGNEWARVWNLPKGGIRVTLGKWNSDARETVVSGLEGISKKDLSELNKQAKLNERELSVKNLNAAQICERIWALEQKNDLLEPGDYGIKKGLPRESGVLCLPARDSNAKYLLVPMRDETGKLWNLQTIGSSGGGKFYKAEGRTKGLFYVLHGHEDRILLCEGYGTGLALATATGFTTYVSFTVTNLEAVLKVILNKYKPHQIVLCADWDGGTAERTGVNPGAETAWALAEKYKTKIALPEIEAPKNIDFADLLPARRMIQDSIATAEGTNKTPPFITFPEPPNSKPKKKKEKKLMDSEPIRNANTEGNIPNIDKVLEEAEKWHHKQEHSSQEASQNLVTSEPVVPGLKVKVINETWQWPEHEIKTRTTGFHHQIPDRGGIKQVPNPQDLRLAFEEEHPFVTHSSSSTLYVYTGTHFKFCEKIWMENFAEKNYFPPPRNSVVKEFVGSVLRLNIVNPEFFTTERKINFQNGWLDLDKMEFRSHSPQYGFKNVLDYAFDPTAQAPTWDAFLSRVLGGNEDLVNMVEEFLGYVISGDSAWAQKALVLQGEGSNGKSTFLRTIRALIGMENHTNAKLNEINQSEYTRERLDGKLANIAEETPKEALMDSSIFKDIVGGGRIQVRHIYGSPYDLEVKAKLIFSCNELPVVTDLTHAFFRRLLIVPFDVTFSDDEADTEMPEKLQAELPGILNRCLVAYLRLKKRKKFILAESSKAAIAAYREDSDHVLQWINECVEVRAVDAVDPGWTATVVLYDAFKDWAIRRGFKQITQVKFTGGLKKNIEKGKERRTRSREVDHRPWGFSGVKLLGGGENKPWTKSDVVQF